MAEFRTNELKRVESEAQQRYQMELNIMKEAFEKEEDMRRMKLKDMETGLEAEVDRKRRDCDAENYKERQRLLQEQEAFKLRQETLEKEMELARKTLALDEERLHRAVAQANDRLKEAEQQKDQFNGRLKAEMQKYQMDFDREHAQLLIGLKTEKAKLEAQTAVHDGNQKQVQTLLEKVSALEKELSSTKQLHHAAVLESGSMKKELDAMRASSHQWQSSRQQMEAQAKQSLNRFQMESSQARS